MNYFYVSKTGNRIARIESTEFTNTRWLKRADRKMFKIDYFRLLLKHVLVLTM